LDYRTNITTRKIVNVTAKTFITSIWYFYKNDSRKLRLYLTVNFVSK